MSKSIYEEALEKIDVGFDTWDRADRFEFVRHALKQAQKQEELLELYKELAAVRDDMIYTCKIIDETETQLEKEIKELENE